jgi:DNA-binding MarR family transcriptional regulator
VLEAREALLSRLSGVLEQGGDEGSRACAPLVAEGLVGAAFAIVYKRLLKGERGALSDLHGELMGMIVLPYLGSAAAGRERRRHAPRLPGGTAHNEPGSVGGWREDALKDVPMRLTYRTALVLGVTAQNPGASNRTIGERADIHDQGQISKLLGRLERIGLLQNESVGHAKGEPNAWRLTSLGERVAEQLAPNINARQDIA